MKLILHIMGKDLRMLRGRLGIWLGILAAKYGVGLYLVLRADVSEDIWPKLQGAMLGMIGATDVALTLLMSALLVQEDNLVETTVFWRTRPVSGARLLTAKLAGLVTFLGLPAVLIALPWWLVCGFGPEEIAIAAGETLAVQLILGAVAITFAAITGTMGRFFIWGGVTVAAMFIVSGLWIYSARRPPVGDGDRLVAQLAVVAGTMAAVVLVQYLTRETRRSLVCLAAGLALSVAVGRYWPWEIFEEVRPWGARTESNPTLAQGLKLDLKSTHVSRRVRDGDDGKRQDVSLILLARDLPPGLVLGSGVATHRWLWAADSSLTRDSWIHGRPEASQGLRTALGMAAPVPDAETEAWHAKHPQKRRPSGAAVLVEGTADVTLWSGLPLTSSTVSRLQKAPPPYRMEANLDPIRPVRVMEIPARPSGWHAKNGRGLRVTRTTSNDNGVVVGLVETAPAFATRDLRQNLNYTPRMKRAAAYVLMHRASGFLNSHSAAMGPFVILGGVAVSSRTLPVPMPQVVREGVWRPTSPAWRDEMSIAVVALPVVASFSREVAVERFEFAP